MTPSKIISVAPMEGVTTFPMRLWLHMTSQPERMTSPFLRVTRSSPDRELPAGFLPELLDLPGALPYALIPQFISGDPEQFLRAAAFLPPDLAPVIEINCGCPSPNSLGKLAGSGMLSDPTTFAQVIHHLCQELGPGRLAVKMRLGIETDQEFPALLQGLADLPLARLTVHARTRADGYRGHARWPLIQQAAKALRIPVHASGDVLGLETWQELQTEAPHIAGAMIGRGLLRNPWLILELRTGRTIRLQVLTLINALFCYLLLQDLWLKHPQKLLARVASGRLAIPCGTDFSAWEKQTAELSHLALGMPFLLLGRDSLQSWAVSPVAFARLRFVWLYCRSSLPEAFASPSLLRCKNPQDFFDRLFLSAESLPLTQDGLELRHQAQWDQQFAGARG